MSPVEKPKQIQARQTVKPTSKVRKETISLTKINDTEQLLIAMLGKLLDNN